MREAARLFRTKGFEATSTRLLADAIGIQSATLYYYMDSKEDLLYRICLQGNDIMIAAVTAAVEDAPSPSAALRAAIKAHLHTAVENRDVYLTTLAEMRALSPRRQRAVIARRDQYSDLIGDLLEQAQKAGEVRRDISSDELMLVVRNMLSWTIFSYSREDPHTVDELAELMIKVFFEGVNA